MHGDLLELCRCAQFPRPNMHSVTIRKQAIDLTLAQICAGPQPSLYMFVVFLCQWPKQEARLTLLELVGSTSEVNRPLGWRLERFYDLLVAIIQVKGGWRRIVAEAAILLDKTSPLVITHPIHLVFAEVMTDLAKSPLQQTSTTFAMGGQSLAKLQVDHPRYLDSRMNTWAALQAHGLRLEDRMMEIDYALSQMLEVPNHQTFDATADAPIFTSEHFSSGLRSAAFEHLRLCLTSKWEVFWDPLECYPTFYKELEFRMESGDRTDLGSHKPSQQICSESKTQLAL
ncbi:hypothetical protein DFH06DRAFT_674266 [Mycena polygramma]|nr:hypothetical protein DFH06DRAFT_674266 [Mycena polygramma]